MRYPVWIALLVFLSVATRPLRAESPKWEPVTPAELAEDKPQIEPSAAAEILRYRIEIDDTQEGSRNRLTQSESDDTHGERRKKMTQIRFKIYDPGRAVDATRVVQFWFSSTGQNYDEIMARLTLPDGTSRVFDKHDLRERSVGEMGRANGFLGLLGSHSYRSVGERFLAVTGMVKGAVLDVWEWEPNMERTDWQTSTIQRPDTPIRQFEYVSRYTPDKENLCCRSYVLNPYGGTLTHDEKAGIVRFTAQNLPSIRREPLAPPDTYFSLTIIETYEHLERYLDRRHLSVRLPDPVPLSLGPWAFFSTGQDFQDADKGYATKRIKEKADELVAGVADPREKARRIYDYVQALYQRFRNRADLEDCYRRYVESADELIDLDKIDSTIIRERDFYYLFVALARSAGLECHSVFNPWRTAFPFRVDLMSEQFLSGRTMAVKTGDDWILCDPWSDVPLGFAALHWEFEGQLALMAMPRQQTFLNVPPTAPESSSTETAVELDLDAEGNLQGQCVRTFTGHAAHVVREKLRNKGQERWWTLARSLLDLDNSSSEVRLLKVEGLDSPEEPVRLHAALRWSAYAPVLGDRMLFALSVWREGRPPLLNETNRTTPVFFHFPNVEKEVIAVHLPPGYRPATLPKPIAASSGEFSYSLSATHDPGHNVLTVERAATNRAIDIPVADYARARDWFQRVGVADQIGIVLSNRADPPVK